MREVKSWGVDLQPLLLAFLRHEFDKIKKFESAVRESKSESELNKLADEMETEIEELAVDKFRLFPQDFDIMFSSLPSFMQIVPRDSFERFVSIAEKKILEKYGIKVFSTSELVSKFKTNLSFSEAFFANFFASQKSLFI